MLRFANMELFWFLALAPAMALFYWYVFRKKREAMKRFGNLKLMSILAGSTRKNRQVWKAVLVTLTALLMILALMRPQIGTRLEEVRRQGLDILVALDLSYSMLAEDIKPNRLAKAKHEIEGILSRLRGDRIGLIAFAGESFVQCPLTMDYGAARIFLDAMTPAAMPVPGTNIGAAIRTAMKTFDAKERKYKVLILITDGEDHGETAVKLAEEASKEGVIIYTVGIGSREGVPIPVQAEGGGSGFKKTRDGDVVISKLDEATLEKIALATNGKYYRASSGEEELNMIYEDIMSMEKKELGTIQFSQFEDRFQYILAFALLFLLIEFFLPERRNDKNLHIMNFDREAA